MKDSMLDKDLIKESVEKFQEKFAEIEDNNKQVENAKNTIQKRRDEHDDKYEDIILEESTNPFTAKKAQKAKEDIDEKEQEIAERAEEYKKYEEDTKKEFDSFTEELKQKINKRKEEIKYEADNPGKTQGELEEQKNKLLKEQEGYQKTVSRWEENNINEEDVIYTRLKGKIKDIDAKVAEIDDEITGLDEEKLSKEYDELEKFGKIVENQHTMDNKLKELAELVGAQKKRKLKKNKIMMIGLKMSQKKRK